MAGVLRHTLVVRNPDGVATALLAGKPVPDWASDLVHPDDFAASDGGDDGKSYSSMNKGELEAEVARRNAERDADEQIEVGGTGKVADLRAALEADDADNA